MAQYWTNTQAAVEITDTTGCKYTSDTILVELDYFEDNASLGDGDTALCIGNILLLSSNAEEAISYLWHDGITTPGHLVDAPGEYSVTVHNNIGCTARDTIDISILGTVPVPDFSQNGQCAENSIEFQDRSTSVDGIINNWQWSYMGEIFATTTNSNFTFDTAGVYPVSLEIFTDVGCHHIITKDIQIHPLPIIKFTPAWSCSNNITAFENLSSIASGSIENYEWVFGDGNNSSEISPLHTYTDAGIYNLSLNATSDMGCEDILERNFEIKASQQSNFTASPPCY
jgi:PKD repeat protein